MEYLFSTVIWFFIPISFYYVWEINWKVVSNLTSVVHASFVVMVYLFGIKPEVLYYLSYGYYIYDGILNLYYYMKNRNNGYLFMIAHHIVTAYTLNYLFNPICTELLMKTFFLLEVSNYPLYVVYHLKSMKYDNKYIVGFFILLEALSSIICRMILGSILLYDAYSIEKFPWIIIFMGLFIFMISALWLKAIFKQLYQMFFIKNNKKVE